MKIKSGSNSNYAKGAYNRQNRPKLFQSGAIVLTCFVLIWKLTCLGQTTFHLVGIPCAGQFVAVIQAVYIASHKDMLQDNHSIYRLLFWVISL